MGGDPNKLSVSPLQCSGIWDTNNQPLEVQFGQCLSRMGVKMNFRYAYYCLVDVSFSFMIKSPDLMHPYLYNFYSFILYVLRIIVQATSHHNFHLTQNVKTMALGAGVGTFMYLDPSTEGPWCVLSVPPIWSYRGPFWLVIIRRSPPSFASTIQWCIFASPSTDLLPYQVYRWRISH